MARPQTLGYSLADSPVGLAAITMFPGDVYRAPRSWAEGSYHKLNYFHEVDKGSHFAAWEQPELFAEEIRASFRSLRWLRREAGNTYRVQMEPI